MTIRLSQLYIYPVKSMAGIPLETGELDAMGLKHDRRWMLVDRDGRFMTQRTHPHMVLIRPAILDDRLVLTNSKGELHEVPGIEQAEERIPVQVWKDQVRAHRLSSATDAWLSREIGEPCRLVQIADDEIRQCDLAYAKEGDRTGFSDGFPLLLLSEGSLGQLNNRLRNPVAMIRFRPNLVVSGCEAHAEDNWREIRIGDIGFRLVKPCSRCPIPTVNPLTGKKEGPEPLKTLMSYRRRDNKVWFGQNLVHEGRGLLRINMPVTISAT
ncbi:MAG: MOSC domain-containing protein [Sedimenticolaceae bacterium]|nr:MOSC domain-containing protein [Sedimenticolaceae bacterium]